VSAEPQLRGVDFKSESPTLGAHTGAPALYNRDHEHTTLEREHQRNRKKNILLCTGQFYDFKIDSTEKLDLASTELAGDAVAAKAKLQAVLDQFQDARSTN